MTSLAFVAASSNEEANDFVDVIVSDSVRVRIQLKAINAIRRKEREKRAK